MHMSCVRGCDPEFHASFLRAYAWFQYIFLTEKVVQLELFLSLASGGAPIYKPQIGRRDALLVAGTRNYM